MIHVSIRQISTFARVFKYYYPNRTGIFTHQKTLRSSVLQFVKTFYQYPDSVECRFKFVKSLNTFHLWPIFMHFKNSKFSARIFWRNWLKSSYHFLSSYNLWNSAVKVQVVTYFTGVELLRIWEGILTLG